MSGNDRLEQPASYPKADLKQAGYANWHCIRTAGNAMACPMGTSIRLIVWKFAAR